jgi:hypothetical protein
MLGQMLSQHVRQVGVLNIGRQADGVNISQGRGKGLSRTFR